MRLIEERQIELQVWNPSMNAPSRAVGGHTNDEHDWRFPFYFNRKKRGNTVTSMFVEWQYGIESIDRLEEAQCMIQFTFV